MSPGLRDPAGGAPKSPVSYRRLLFWGLPIFAVLAAPAAFFAVRGRHPAIGPLPGYDARSATFQREYHQYYGKLVQDPGAERLFAAAAREATGHNYLAAIDLLRSAAKDAAIPLVFTDLGVLLAETANRAQATAAFGEALARDPDYLLVKQNLSRLGGFDPAMGRFVTEEVEPNNSFVNANFIAPGSDVQAGLDEGDTDVFRFVAPPAPRDHIAIEIENRSAALEVGMRLYNGDELLAVDHRPELPGDRIVEYISPRPNTSWYLEIFSAHGTSGAYTLRVAPMHRFDDYEPNDNIFAATPIPFGESIHANILDIEDTDFYSFESPAAGTVTIDIQNRSATLIPALTTFGPDKRTSGFGPDIRKPGESLHHTMEVEAHRTYYLQVWAQDRTNGDYWLTVH